MRCRPFLLFCISILFSFFNFCLAQKPKLVLPVGHTARINTVVFSPNGKKILTASEDKTAKIWDVFTGYLVVNLQGHFGYVMSAEFSPACEDDIQGGSKVITSSVDKTVKIWDAVSGELLKVLKGHDSVVYSAHFSLDAKKIITASADGSAKIWDAVTGEMVKEFKGVRSGNFDSSCTKVLSVSSDNSVIIWDAKTGQKVYQIKEPGTRLFSADLSPDAKKILTTSDDGNGRVYDLHSGKWLYTLPKLSPLNMESFSVKKPTTAGKKTASRDYAVKFSPDSRKIASISNEGTVKLWNAVSGTLLQTTDFKIYFNRKPSVEFSPDGKKIIFSMLKEKMYFPVSDDSGIEEGGISKIIDAGSGKILSSLVLPVDTWTSGFYARFSPACPEDPAGGKNIIIVANQEITVWDQLLKEKSAVLKGYSAPASAVMFSKKNPAAASNESAIITSYNNPVLKSEVYKFWDIHTGNLLAPKSIDTSAVTYIKYSKAGEKMATVSSLGGITIWNISTGKKISEIKTAFGERGGIYFSDDAERLAILEEEGVLSIWNVKTGKLINELTEVEATYGLIFDEIEWSPDGNKIITFRRNLTNSAKVWDVNTGKIIFRFKEPVNYSQWSMQFSNDSRSVINASEGGTVKMWGASSGKLMYELKGVRSVSSVYFSPDGTKLVTASEDGTLNIWNAANGNRLISLPGHSGNLKNYPRINVFAQFSPRCADDTSGGRYIISFTNEDPVIKIWDTNNGKPVVELKGHSDGINGAGFSPDGKFIISASSDNTIKKWDAGTGKCIYTFISFNKDDYMKMITGGYYESTPDITKLLHYVTSDSKVISFDQLDVKYNRPDLVLEAIGNPDTALINTYRNAYYKRIKKLGIDTTSFRDGYSVPEADFVNREKIAAEQTNEMLSMHIKATDSTYKLDRYNVWVNEVPVFGQRGISIRKNDSNNFDKTISIQLSQGENRIETSITNVNGTESYRMPLIVNYTPAVKQKETTYFIGIGIDKFADAHYNLRYCSKDIRDLAVKLKEKYGDAVIIDTLFNENVTVSNIKALKLKLGQTTVNDKVIISYSGHGLLSKTYDYYLSTYSIKFDDPKENGLPYEEMENLLDSIPARKKLMLIDACHSGEVDKEEYRQVEVNKAELDSNHVVSRGVILTGTGVGTKKLGLRNSFELMQNLFVNVGKSTGATVISAAAGTEFALEKGDLKNGVFTYCVMEAIDKYPTMKISDLKKTVGARVTELTKGMQKPTSRNEAIAVDWNVW